MNQEIVVLGYSVLAVATAAVLRIGYQALDRNTDGFTRFVCALGFMVLAIAIIAAIPQVIEHAKNNPTLTYPWSKIYG